jgi:putative component of membrane protein insertase Oxa1/YidC/SpoIIIJ protein YidD
MQKLLNRNNIFLLLLVGSLSLHSQSKDDWELIKNKDFDTNKYPQRHVTYLFKNSHNYLVKYNPLSLTLGGLMYFYQKILSPQIISQCPYELSCSNFSKAVIARYGIIKGMALTADRLMRCNTIAAKDISQFDFNDNNKIVDQPEKYCIHP